MTVKNKIMASYTDRESFRKIWDLNYAEHISFVIWGEVEDIVFNQYKVHLRFQLDEDLKFL